MPHPRIRLSSDVEAALDAGRPLVALESTLISHGLPFPGNLELARRLESTVRDNGATPATIALADGEVRVGIDAALLERLATEEGIAKVSLRDIGLVLAERSLGATTVAATMWAAHQVGIHVFVTGGIGGVHPGDGSDVSGDLPALTTIPVCVVGSGAKAILDLPRTREWLETWGVPVVGFQTREMPAFYSRESGLPADRVVQDEREAARYVRSHLLLGRGGVLLGVPVPEVDALPGEAVQEWIAHAEEAAKKQGIRGHALTPFLLRDLAARSEGQTLRANLALLVNNAAVAARLSVQLNALAS
ncbi:MAG: pseudouridine-5'-phosphate glycosidase [Geodermatophilaceae bacterium]|nr:pseudouridine-5'-phosphate glycosidase [Geodermatophilaceae bacterium]